MNTRRLAPILTPLLLIPVVLSAPSVSAASARPNFVLIFIDDMGYGDIGPYGSKLNRTPNLDRMAAEGMLLTSFYAAPVCSASRSQVMTGSYAPRVSVPGVFFPAGPKGLNPKENTVAELLRKEGYATMCVGKWHLGDQPEFLPTRQGFDHYFGIPYSNDMNKTSKADGRNVCPLLRDEKVVALLDGPGQDAVTEQYTEEAVKFIREKRDGPFFLFFPHTAVHVPIHPGKRFQGKSRNGRYGDWVEEIDWSVGEVLKALKVSGVDDKTLVMFTSDNGPWLSKGSDGGVATPLRGGKGGTLEGGVREPTIARWPGRIAAGSRCDAVAGNIDFLPTFVSLAGGEVPAEPKLDGRDISPLLLGRTKESPHKAWFYYRGTQLKAVRSGPWKLALGPQSPGMGLRDTPADLKAKGLRLYNLDEEIGEVTNVADRNPAIVKRLSALAEAARADIGDGKAGPGVRPAGTVENPVMLYPSDAKPRAKAGKTGRPRKPVNWNALKVGDVVPAASAPAIAGLPFTLSCKVDAKGDNGVVVAHGGTAVGYALYLKDGGLVFAVRTTSQRVDRVKLQVALDGPLPVSAELRKDGTLALSVGRERVEGKGGGLLGRQPQEDFSVGHDSRNPVDPEAPTERWKGKVEALKITIGGAKKK